MLMPSPNHWTQRLPNDDDDEATKSAVVLTFMDRTLPHNVGTHLQLSRLANLGE